MSRAPTIAVLDYGMGNIRSVAKAVEHAGGMPWVTSDRDADDRAAAAVLPGVGAFGACMRGLVDRGLDATVLGFGERRKPLLGVCLGMQVLFESSEEDPGPGIEHFRGRIRRLPSNVKVPHMGWNEVTWTREHPMAAGIPSGTPFYFVHSYAADPDGDATVGTAEHGRRFAAAVASGTLFATQFHPEKSGPAGLRIYRNLVALAS